MTPGIQRRAIFTIPVVASPVWLAAGGVLAMDDGGGRTMLVSAIVAASGLLAGLVACKIAARPVAQPKPIIQPEAEAEAPLPPQADTPETSRCCAEPEPASDILETMRAQALMIRKSTTEGMVAFQQVDTLVREIKTSASGLMLRSQDAARQAFDMARGHENATIHVAQLHDAVARSGAMVATIQSIAEQGNLLALNATIEAARAGEAGLGFAAVASEVKLLAGHTARTTRELTALLTSVQSAATAAQGGEEQAKGRKEAAERALHALEQAARAMEDRMQEIVRRAESAASLVRSAQDQVDQILAQKAEAITLP